MRPCSRRASARGCARPRIKASNALFWIRRDDRDGWKSKRPQKTSDRNGTIHRFGSSVHRGQQRRLKTCEYDGSVLDALVPQTWNLRVPKSSNGLALFLSVRRENMIMSEGIMP